LINRLREIALIPTSPPTKSIDLFTGSLFTGFNSNCISVADRLNRQAKGVPAPLWASKSTFRHFLKGAFQKTLTELAS
jgi:hypothetical protein